MKPARWTLVLPGLLLALWMQLGLGAAAYAGPLARPLRDDCAQYIKNPANFLTMPRALLEDCARTPGAQAIVTAIVASVAGAATAAAVAQALAQAAAGQAGRPGAGAGGAAGKPGGAGSATTETVVYGPKSSIRILAANNLVRWNPNKEPPGYEFTERMNNWLNNPLAGRLPIKGTRTTGRATDDKGQVTYEETIQLTGLDGIGYKVRPNGTIEITSIVVQQTQPGQPDGQPGGWQPVSTIPVEQARQNVLTNYGYAIPSQRQDQVKNASVTSLSDDEFEKRARTDQPRRPQWETLNGYVDQGFTGPQIVVRRDREHGDIQHEMIHVAENPAFVKNLGRTLHEAAAEYFTRDFTDPAGVRRTTYSGGPSLIRPLVQAAGKDKVVRAFFGEGQREVDALRDHVGARTWRQIRQRGREMDREFYGEDFQERQP
jgi:hypothetical protein